MGALSDWLRRHSRNLNVIAAGLLLSTIFVTTLLIVLLYLCPDIYLLDSFTDPLKKGISPATAVSFVASVLVAAVSTLITAAVEQNLWHKLQPRQVRNNITVGETRRLAQWSVSSLERLYYIIEGSSWMLKFCGIALFGMVVVNPLLVAGISQKPIYETSATIDKAEFSKWQGYIDPSNLNYNGGNGRDIPGELAAITSMSNISAPAARVCPRTTSTKKCTATANLGMLKATCKSWDEPWPLKFIIASSLHASKNVTIHSRYNPDATATLRTGMPYTYANFSMWPAPQEPGNLAVIFGSWIEDNADFDGPWTLRNVDCLVQFGTINVTQTGLSSPELDMDTFRLNKTTTVPAYLNALRRVYLPDSTNNNGPYHFEGNGTPDRGDVLYESMVGYSLIENKGSATAARVAEKIEKSFEMGALMAFAREPRAADVRLETTITTLRYRYDWRYLLALLLPAFCMLALLGRWRIYGADVVVGYDPIGIAIRGPVKGLSAGPTIDEVEVCCVKGPEVSVEDHGLRFATI